MKEQRRYTIWLLHRWRYLIEHRADLIGGDKKAATAFFRALTALPDDEVNLLARKYNTGVLANPNYRHSVSDKAATDAELAPDYGMVTWKFQNYRRKIEDKLAMEYYKELAVVEQREKDRWASFKYKVGAAYFVSEELTGQYTMRMTLTYDPDGATVYTEEPDLMNKGALIKVPAHGDGGNEY